MKFNAITHDLDDLTIADDGSFRVILSPSSDPRVTTATGGSSTPRSASC